MFNKVSLLTYLLTFLSASECMLHTYVSSRSIFHRVVTALILLLRHWRSTYTIQWYTVDKTIKQKHHPRKNLTEVHYQNSIRHYYEKNNKQIVTA